MTHSLPLLDDLPLATLLRVRREDRDSFGRYRLAVQRILTEVASKQKRVSKEEVRELFRDRIEPALTTMKSEIYQERHRQRRRIAGGIGALAASVMLGAFGGIVPLGCESSSCPGGVLGTGLVSKAAQSVCEYVASLREKNDFYFLLRLCQEAKVESQAQSPG